MEPNLAVAGGMAVRRLRDAGIPGPGLAREHLVRRRDRLAVLACPEGGRDSWVLFLVILVTVVGSSPARFVERVVDRLQRSTGASRATCAFGRATCAASASGAAARVSRNEQVVGSIPTGGSGRDINSNASNIIVGLSGGLSTSSSGRWRHWADAEPQPVGRGSGL